MATTPVNPAQPEAHEQLVQTIEGLEPEKVEGELGSLMGRDGRDLLGRTVATGDINASLDVLGAVEGAIERVDSPDTRTMLGEMASGSVVGALRHNDFDPIKAIGLGREAKSLAEFIADPREKAFAFMYLSSEMARRIPGLENDHSPLASDELKMSLALQSNGFLSDARTSALEIEDPRARSHMLIMLGDTSVVNFGFSTNQLTELPGNRDGTRARRSVVNFPSVLYGDAIEAANQIDDSGERVWAKADVAVSTASASGKLKGKPFGDGDHISVSLAKKTKEQISELTDLYETDKSLSKLFPAEKARDFVRIGAKLAKAIDEDHGERVDDVRYGLTTDMLDTFWTARMYTDRIRKPRISSSLSGKKQPKQLAQSVAVAAGRFVSADIENAEELYEVAFDLAVVEDRFRRQHSNEVSNVMGSIHERAKQTSDTSLAFSLFSTAHMLEADRLDVTDIYHEASKFSHMLGVNARRASTYLSEAKKQDTGVDEINPNFVEFIRLIEHEPFRLYGLARHVKDRALQDAIVAEAASIELAREEERRPKTELSRLAETAIRQSFR